MTSQIIIGLIAEGTTDVKFLKNVIFRTVEEVSWECKAQLDIYDIQLITAKGDSFVEKMTDALRKAYAYTNALCIHADADSATIDRVMQRKFKPLFDSVALLNEESICKVIIPTIPVQMIESWMLADKSLLKRLINAGKLSDTDLFIDKMPEQYADPKSVINEAIRIAMSSHTKRRRDQITIDDLYETLGNQIDLTSLRLLPSYRIFEENVRDAFRKLKLLQ